MKKEKVPGEIHKDQKWFEFGFDEYSKLMNIVKKLVFSGLLLPGTWKV